MHRYQTTWQSSLSLSQTALKTPDSTTNDYTASTPCHSSFQMGRHCQLIRWECRWVARSSHNSYPSSTVYYFGHRTLRPWFFRFLLSIRRSFHLYSQSHLPQHQIQSTNSSLISEHHTIRLFLLPNHEYVTCVLWNGLYHISRTDIVRALQVVFRFEVSSSLLDRIQKKENWLIVGFWETSWKCEEIWRGYL